MRKGTKKLMALLCAAGVVFSMFGCGGETPETKPAGKTVDGTVAEEAVSAITKADKEYKIAVLLPGPTGYFVATKAGIDAAADESGVTIEYADSQWDSGKQVAQAENVIMNGVDLLALCCVDSAAGEQIVKLANEAEIPIIAFCNAIGENENGQHDGLVSYVGQNEVNTGKVTGEVAKSLLGEKGGKAVLIEGVPGTTPQINRRKGLEKALEGSGIEIIYSETSNWEKEKAARIVEKLMIEGTEFDIVICQDDNSATGVGQALTEAGVKDKVFVTGLGGSISGLRAIRDGRMDGTTYMSAVEEGRTTIDVAVRSLNGETVSEVTEIKQVEVNKENVEQFKGEW